MSQYPIISVYSFNKPLRRNGDDHENGGRPGDELDRAEEEGEDDGEPLGVAPKDGEEGVVEDVDGDHDAVDHREEHQQLVEV